ncbi:NTP transferase domain-containing protein [Microbacterium sp. 2FI]|uniref:molybdenum cofactor guanylyltransferase n=1 Tax=Microbacterium sp. 2FI TaxID=2502193 RepID=UPI0010F5FADF|nr:NTP transferase domain-containing protein [Microbacterium sp. 2FI]
MTQDHGPNPHLGAILLAGGRASRVDGAVKPLFEVGGRTLLATAVAAAADAAAHPISVVAPVLDPGLPVTWVHEDPPFGGPAAAIIAALSSWPGAPEAPDPEWTLVLACDLPGIDAAVRRLVSDIVLLPSDTDGMCLGDASSRPQWLVGAYRTRALRTAASALPDGGRDAPVRAILDDLAITVVAAADDLTRDVDTWEDLVEARAAAAPHEAEESS